MLTAVCYVNQPHIRCICAVMCSDVSTISMNRACQSPHCYVAKPHDVNLCAALMGALQTRIDHFNMSAERERSDLYGLPYDESCAVKAQVFDYMYINNDVFFLQSCLKC